MRPHDCAYIVFWSLQYTYISLHILPALVGMWDMSWVFDELMVDWIYNLAQNTHDNTKYPRRQHLLSSHFRTATRKKMPKRSIIEDILKKAKVRGHRTCAEFTRLKPATGRQSLALSMEMPWFSPYTKRLGGRNQMVRILSVARCL